MNKYITIGIFFFASLTNANFLELGLPTCNSDGDCEDKIEVIYNILLDNAQKLSIDITEGLQGVKCAGVTAQSS